MQSKGHYDASSWIKSIISIESGEKKSSKFAVFQKCPTDQVVENFTISSMTGFSILKWNRSGHDFWRFLDEKIEMR